MSVSMRFAKGCVRNEKGSCKRTKVILLSFGKLKSEMEMRWFVRPWCWCALTTRIIYRRNLFIYKNRSSCRFGCIVRGVVVLIVQ